MTVVQLTWKWRGCWAGVRCISLLHMIVFCICQLASTWRSGSTFLAEILTSSQPSFYHYEPLLQFNVTQVRGSDTPARKHSAHRIINKLFDCDFYDLGMSYWYSCIQMTHFSQQSNPLSEVLTVLKVASIFQTHISKRLAWGQNCVLLWQFCSKGKVPVCYRADFLSKFCRAFPVQVMKTVRLRVDLTRNLLERTRYFMT